MNKLKDLLTGIDDGTSESSSDNELEVFADSVKQALELASDELAIDLSNLDYEILEKGNSGFFGIQLYRGVFG